MLFGQTLYINIRIREDVFSYQNGLLQFFNPCMKTESEQVVRFDLHLLFRHGAIIIQMSQTWCCFNHKPNVVFQVCRMIMAWNTNSFVVWSKYHSAFSVIFIFLSVWSWFRFFVVFYITHEQGPKCVSDPLSYMIFHNSVN